MPRMTVTAANDSAEIDDEMVRKLCGSTPEEARQLASLLPMEARVQIALFCNARSHLRERGLAIAKECTPEAFHLEAGFAGTMLHAQANGTVDGPTFSPYVGSRWAVWPV